MPSKSPFSQRKGRLLHERRGFLSGCIELFLYVLASRAQDLIQLALREVLGNVVRGMYRYDRLAAFTIHLASAPQLRLAAARSHCQLARGAQPSTAATTASAT